MRNFAAILLTILFVPGNVQPAVAQTKDVNYDEAQVPSYTLPDPLRMQDGAKVAAPETWRTRRRPELLQLFEEHVYGRSPRPADTIRFAVTSVDPRALGGKATRKEVAVFLTGRTDGPKMDLLLYLPNGVPKPAPAFLGLNFYGNHCVHADRGIKLSTQWMRPTKEMGIVNFHATEASRGCHASLWQVEMVLQRGYALATAYYGDLEPDFPQGWKMGLRGALSADGDRTVFKPGDWGHRRLGLGPQPRHGLPGTGSGDRREARRSDRPFPARQNRALGRRSGRTLRPGHFQRFGRGRGLAGAAAVRRKDPSFDPAFPHWFCGRYAEYDEKENALPVDVHELIALMAPRPVYVASASEDLWADPRGEFLAAKYAQPVYQLLGLPGLGVDDMPVLGRPVGDSIGYHLRAGKHDVTAFDWKQYLDFADRHFRHGPGAKK